ncbi:hypothetical protein TcasGA2_TC011203 [Tribolium castaneum]|uniref:Uncharacterized protein n=1 Tax=Tribolium castaneum TaxID=7070 RepID=D6X3S4_TRICA|nr:hypothetical protein TcasGA2_TC011203 [Tribolium castaneum]
MRMKFEGNICSDEVIKINNRVGDGKKGSQWLGLAQKCCCLGDLGMKLGVGGTHPELGAPVHAFGCGRH